MFHSFKVSEILILQSPKVKVKVSKVLICHTAVVSQSKSKFQSFNLSYSSSITVIVNDYHSVSLSITQYHTQRQRLSPSITVIVNNYPSVSLSITQYHSHSQ